MILCRATATAFLCSNQMQTSPTGELPQACGQGGMQTGMEAAVEQHTLTTGCLDAVPLQCNHWKWLHCNCTMSILHGCYLLALPAFLTCLQGNAQASPGGDGRRPGRQPGRWTGWAVKEKEEVCLVTCGMVGGGDTGLQPKHMADNSILLSI